MLQDGAGDNLDCIQQIRVVTMGQRRKHLSHQPRDQGTVAELGMQGPAGSPEPVGLRRLFQQLSRLCLPFPGWLNCDHPRQQDQVARQGPQHVKPRPPLRETVQARTAGKAVPRQFQTARSPHPRPAPLPDS